MEEGQHVNEAQEHSGAILPPVRGLVPLHNAKGKAYRDINVLRWVRLLCAVHKVRKIDLLAHGEHVARVSALVAALREPRRDVPWDLPISLRTDCAAPPEVLGALDAAGLHDVFLCPADVGAAGLDAWLAAAAKAGLPVRVQLPPPFDAPADAIVQRVAKEPVVAVNVVLSDPFLDTPPCRNAEESRAAVEAMQAVVSGIDAQGIEADLYGLPFCLVAEERRGLAGNSGRFFLDHQQYARAPYELAAELFARPVSVAGKVISIQLGRSTAQWNPVNERLLEWLMTKHRWTYIRLLLLHKLTRNLRMRRKTPEPVETSKEVSRESYEKALEEARQEAARQLGPECSECSLRRICDHETETFKRILPGLSVKAQAGDVCPSPAVYMRDQRKHLDVVDEARARTGAYREALAAEANRIASNVAPTRRLDKGDYEVENAYCVPMPGALRWNALANGEKLSTPLGRLEAPYTISVTFGGGIADHIGFAVGRDTRLLCPMEAYTHKLVLHVAAGGGHVLLRDGTPVCPSEFEGVAPPPARLRTVAEPRIAIWNIDETIVTQNVLLWEGDGPGGAATDEVKYSVVVVSTRFARRLQAVLGSIAHQRDLDPAKIEVVIGYVPGIDATDDLIDSVQLAHPDLRIVRSPFEERRANSKGFIINESVKLASGDWVVLLDSDIVLPPDFFARMEALPEECGFAAPDGRKMLTRETTAAILLGEMQPWRDWEAIFAAPGDVRTGDRREGGHLPVGFCQCVKASCFDTIKYNEYEHFEGADWEFAVAVSEQCGPCAWLDVPVLHLEHGGSQWYGTQKHL